MRFEFIVLYIQAIWLGVAIGTQMLPGIVCSLKTRFLSHESLLLKRPFLPPSHGKTGLRNCRDVAKNPSAGDAVF